MNNISDFIASFRFMAATRRTYEDVLPRVLDMSQDLSGLSAAKLIEQIEKSGWGNKRQCLALSVCQKFLRWKYGSNHPALTARIKRVEGKVQPALNPDLALKLLASFDRHIPKGARDLALCALALETGLRAAELCRLSLEDVDLERGLLQVIVKGGQWRAAVFCAAVAAHIDHWLNFRKSMGPNLFTHMRTGAGLTPEGLNQIVRQWGLVIGIHLSPHMFRRSTATFMALMSANERTLMLGLRWTDPSMPKLYTRSMELDAVRRYSPVQGLLEGRLNRRQ